MISSPIDTRRAVLSPLRESDADEMAPVLADVALYEFTGGEPPSVDSLTDRYRHQAAGSGQPDEVWCNWIIRTKIDRRAVGFIQATVTGRSADVAWVVGVHGQGRGLATEAAAAACDWLAANDICRIEAHIHPQHVASQTVAARIGLGRTGEFDSEGEEIWAAGEIPDSHESPDPRPVRLHPTESARRQILVRHDATGGTVRHAGTSMRRWSALEPATWLMPTGPSPLLTAWSGSSMRSAAKRWRDHWSTPR